MTKKFQVWLIGWLLTVVAAWAQDGQGSRLWYDRPAEAWEEALPLGNGSLGAMVWGTVDEELIQLNEATLWSGGPQPTSMNPEASKYLPQVREALAQKDFGRANELCKRMQGLYSQSYMPLGDLHIAYRYPRWLDGRPPGGDLQRYRRELVMDEARASVSFVKAGNAYERSMYVSEPDQAMVIHLTGRDMWLDISVTSPMNPELETRGDNTIVMRGRAPWRVDPNYYNKP
ncbi:MAG: glycoside hydrolase family 95 protein, partial [Bacteroidaceae bacterium]|nr:glycoside hydrolase family 95 protein [Bacteroidaceae bacterium]